MLVISSKEKAVFLGFLFTLLMSLAGFAEKCESINEKILRLHIKANSDSVEDQDLKLKVRDRVLIECKTIFESTHDIVNAEQNIIEKFDFIKQIAENEIKNNGYDYKVNVEFKNMFFKTKKYDEFTLPSGFYDSVRITIGDGYGQNWWCILYPQVCLSAASENEDLNEILTPNEQEIINNEEEKYEIRFIFVEYFTQIKVRILDFFSDTDEISIY